MTSKGLLTEISEDDTIRIVLLVNFETPSYIKGYHEYQNIWTPFLQEELCGEMEPANPADRYAVAFKKNNVVVGHLPLGCSDKFAKTIFCFLSADGWSECKVIVNGKPVNRARRRRWHASALFAKVPWTEKPYWHTEAAVRCNEIATFNYILRMHTCITSL